MTAAPPRLRCRAWIVALVVAGAASLAVPPLDAAAAASAAKPDTVWHGVYGNPGRQVRYGSYEAACVAVRRIVGQVLGVRAERAEWRRRTKWFEYRGDSLVFSRGYRGAVDVRFAGPERADSVSTLEMEYQDGEQEPGEDAGLGEAFLAAGWMQLYEYEGLGDDAQREVYACEDAYCSVLVQWPSADDPDTSATAPPPEPIPGIWIGLDVVPPPTPRTARRAR